MSEIPTIIQDLAKAVGGTINECQRLPDGSGFATMSMPLPKDHWLTMQGWNVPPMPFRCGTNQQEIIIKSNGRNDLADKIRSAAKYAIRASTMNGKETDFDPDAMVQNFVIGMLGYWTIDGLSSDDWANPKT